MLAVVFALLVQESADDFLKRVEETGVKAAAIAWSAQVLVSHAGNTDELAMIAWFAGKACRHRATGSTGGAPLSVRLDCNGTTWTAGDGKATSDPVKAADGMALRLRLFVLRGGIAMLLRRTADGNVHDLFEIKDAQFAADEARGRRTLRVVTFTLTKTDEKSSFAVKLWIDAETLSIVKRDSKGGKESILEVYEEAPDGPFVTAALGGGEPEVITLGKSKASPYRAHIATQDAAAAKLAKKDYAGALALTSTIPVHSWTDARLKLQKSDSSWEAPLDYFPSLIEGRALLGLAQGKATDGKKEAATLDLTAARRRIRVAVLARLPGAVESWDDADELARRLK